MKLGFFFTGGSNPLRQASRRRARMSQFGPSADSSPAQAPSIRCVQGRPAAGGRTALSRETGFRMPQIPRARPFPVTFGFFKNDSGRRSGLPQWKRRRWGRQEASVAPHVGPDGLDCSSEPFAHARADWGADVARLSVSWRLPPEIIISCLLR